MLDMHHDIVCMVKGLWLNNRDRGSIDLQQMVTWQAVTEGIIATLFIHINFKFINGNGQLIDYDGFLLDNVNPP